MESLVEQSTPNLEIRRYEIDGPAFQLKTMPESPSAFVCVLVIALGMLIGHNPPCRLNCVPRPQGPIRC